jgi:hypothetical protein
MSPPNSRFAVAAVCIPRAAGFFLIVSPRSAAGVAGLRAHQVQAGRAAVF